MKKLEKILATIFVLTAILKFFEVVGSSIFVTITCCLMMALYGIFGFALFNSISFKGIFQKSAYAGVKAGHIITAILSGYFISCTVAAVLFVIMNWTGVRVMVFCRKY